MATGLVQVLQGPDEVALEHPLTPNRVKVSVHACDAVYTVRLEEEYTNGGPRAADIIYRFRTTGNEMYVTDFNADLGGVQYGYRVTEKIGPSDNMAVAEVLSQEPLGALLARLGRLAPQARCAVAVEYTTHVTVTRSGACAVVVPYNVLPAALRSQVPSAYGQQVLYEVALAFPSPVRNVTAPHDSISVQYEGQLAFVEVLRRAPIAQDLVLHVDCDVPLASHWLTLPDGGRTRAPPADAALLVLHERDALAHAARAAAPSDCDLVPWATFVPCFRCGYAPCLYHCSCQCGFGVCGACHTRGHRTRAALHHPLWAAPWPPDGRCAHCPNPQEYRCAWGCDVGVCGACYNGGRRMHGRPRDVHEVVLVVDMSVAAPHGHGDGPPTGEPRGPGGILPLPASTEGVPPRFERCERIGTCRNVEELC